MSLIPLIRSTLVEGGQKGKSNLLEDNTGEVRVSSHGGPDEILARDPAYLVVLTPVLQVAGAIVLQEGPSLVQPPGNRHQADQEGILQREIFNFFSCIEQLLKLQHLVTLSVRMSVPP